MTIYYLVLLIVVNYVAYTLVTEYWRSTEKGFDRILAAAKGSATILWARFSAIVGAVAGLLIGVADYMQMPEVKEWITKWFTAEHTALVIVLIAIITEWARRRTLDE